MIEFLLPGSLECGTLPVMQRGTLQVSGQNIASVLVRCSQSDEGVAHDVGNKTRAQRGAGGVSC